MESQDEMVPACRVCLHGEVISITRALLFGQSPRSIARRYASSKLSRKDLVRHRDVCFANFLERNAEDVEE